MVSATSFLALIMLGRWTDANQLGAYATAVSVLALLLAAQESLITRPYTIQMDRLPGAPAEHAFSSLVLSILFSAVAMCVLTAAALPAAVCAVGAVQMNHNELSDWSEIEALSRTAPAIETVYLEGNQAICRDPRYRQRLTALFKQLTQIDANPL